MTLLEYNIASGLMRMHAGFWNAQKRYNYAILLLVNVPKRVSYFGTTHATRSDCLTNCAADDTNAASLNTQTHSRIKNRDLPS